MKHISVFIPTYNGRDNIAECLDVVLRQKLPRGYELEVIVIDSGSSDGTVEVLENYKDKVNFSKIPNSEFSHGGTRDKAAKMAKGEFVLYLTQDATPAHDRWLINMIEPFFVSDKIACVFGRQTPRPNAPPTIKREILNVFGGFGPPDSILIQRDHSLVDNTQTNDLNNFFSDVNSAVRREVVVNDVPFRNVPYAEDQLLAKDMQSKGYLKAYAPLGEVIHSNNYTARQYFHRKFDEYIGLHETTGMQLVASKRSLLLGWVRPTMADWIFTIKDGQYTSKSKLVWLLEAPFYNLGLKVGLYKAAKNLHSPKKRDEYSLEKKIRG